MWLLQKERVGALSERGVSCVYICVNHGRLVFISGAEDCWSVSFRSLICRLWRRNSLVCGLSVSAVKVHCMKMCCVPGIYTLGLDNIANILYSIISLLVIVNIPVNKTIFCFLFQSRLSHLLHEEESAERFRRSGEAHLPFWLVMDEDLFFCLQLSQHSFFILPQWRRVSHFIL